MTTKQSHRGYDFLAPFYDTLTQLVFGAAIGKSHRAWLHCTPPKAKVLILGGGTGEVLKQLLAHCPEAQVTYIEASAKMIALSKEKVDSKAQVDFVLGTATVLEAAEAYDVVIAQYFLDLFGARQLEVVMEKLVHAIKPQGMLFFADFQRTGILWQRILLKTMYAFFYWCCRIESRRLPDWEQVFACYRLKRSKRVTFYRGMIASEVWTKKE